MKEFSKMMKKIRIDNNETLSNMANKLKISTAYLSQIENGKRAIPHNFIEMFEKEYYSSLSDKKIIEFESCVRNMVKNVVIPINDLSDSKKKLSFDIAKGMKTLSESDEKEIRKILIASEKVKK